MPTAFRFLVVALLVVAIGVPARARAQGRPSPSGDPVPAPAPGPKPEPEPPLGESPSPDEPAPPAEFVHVTGHERLAWNQAALSNEDLGVLRYTVYVNGEPHDAGSVSCASEPAPEGFECSSPLPPMAAGRHTIEVTAYQIVAGVRLESFRSPPVHVQLGPSDNHLSASSVGATSVGMAGETSPEVDRSAGIGGVRLQAEELVAGLDDPTDIAALRDGRVLIAERAGRIRMVRDGILLRTPAARLPDAVTGDGRGLLSIAADRAFDETGHVFALFSTPSGLALARFTIHGDTLVDRAVLLDGLPISASRPAASIRMGPDGKLYVGLDSRGDRRSVGDLGSYSGKVLRLNPDGTTPDDQPGRSPVFAAGLDYPAGLAWNGDGSTLWVAGRDGLTRDRLEAVAAERSDPLAGALGFLLPAGTGPSAMVVYEGAADFEFEGNLLIGASQANGMLRVWFDETGGVASTEWLQQDELGSVRALAVGTDGAIYAVNDHALLRVTARGK